MGHDLFSGEALSRTGLGKEASLRGREGKQEGHSWYDLHTHTTFSDGIMTPVEDLLFALYATPLDGLVFTDHNDVRAYDMAADFLASRDYQNLLEVDPHDKKDFCVLRGIEISAEKDVHIIGLNIRERIPKKLSFKETIQAIHQQGGIALAPHPYAHFPGIFDYRGVADAFRDKSLGFDGVEALNGSLVNIFLNEKAHCMNQKSEHPLAEYGGSDSHWPGTIGVAATGFPGKGWEDIKKAFQEKSTYPVGRMWTPFDMAAGLSRYCRLRMRLGKVGGFSTMLRRPSQMMISILHAFAKNTRRLVRYRLKGRKVRRFEK